MASFIKVLITTVLFASLTGCNPVPPATSQLLGLRPLTEEQALQDFEQAVIVFRGLYGPLEYKQRHAFVSLDFEDLVEKTRQEIKDIYATGKATDIDFASIMRKFVTAFKDGHVGIYFKLNSENVDSYTIPLQVMPVKDETGTWQAVVVKVEEELKDESIAVGDVITHVDGKTPFELLEVLQQYKSRGNALTDRHLVSGIFNRSFLVKELKPVNEIARIEFQKPDEDFPRSMTYPWKVTKNDSDLPTMLETKGTQSLVVDNDIAPIFMMGKDTPFFVTKKSKKKYKFKKRGQPSHETLKKFDLTPSQAAPIYYLTYEYEGTDILLIRQKGYMVPDVSELNQENYDAHIEAIRRWIQTYKAIMYENENVDVLVVDQTHNPGGSSFYVFDFFRLFIDRPALSLVQLNNVDRKWVSSYLEEYEYWKEKKKMARAQRILGYAQIVENASEAGSLLSKPVTFDYDYFLQPYEDYTWKKPVLVLADELAGSCGDIFPMLIKANKTAKIFGQRTMGLGGNVEGVNLTNSNAFLRVTRGLFTAYNPAGDYPDEVFVENNGVTPDIAYEHSLEDVRAGYIKYIEAFSKAAVEQSKAALPLPILPKVEELAPATK